LYGVYVVYNILAGVANQFHFSRGPYDRWRFYNDSYTHTHTCVLFIRDLLHKHAGNVRRRTFRRDEINFLVRNSRIVNWKTATSSYVNEYRRRPFPRMGKPLEKYPRTKKKNTNHVVTVLLFLLHFHLVDIVRARRDHNAAVRSRSFWFEKIFLFESNTVLGGWRGRTVFSTPTRFQTSEIIHTPCSYSYGYACKRSTKSRYKHVQTSGASVWLASYVRQRIQTIGEKVTER